MIRKVKKGGEVGTVINHTLTGHTINEGTGQPEGGTAIWLLRFKNGDERWHHEDELEAESDS